jgi:hypothetical protein
MLLLFIGSAAAQDQTGITQGGYSPAFDLMMQQKDESGEESCSAPSHSAPKCVNPDPTTVRDHPWPGKPPECGKDQDGERGEVRATDKSTGAPCMMWGYCRCGPAT